MAMEKREIIILLMVTLGINYALVQLASLGIGITCPNLQTTYGIYNENITSGNHSYSENFGFRDIINMATGRCENLPFVLVLLIELPLLVALGISLKEALSPLS